MPSRPLTVNRRRIIVALLRHPGRSWTVRELADAVPGVPAGAVRDTINQFLAENILRQVPGRRALTALLTEAGQGQLARLVPQSAGTPRGPPPATRRGRQPDRDDRRSAIRGSTGMLAPPAPVRCHYGLRGRAGKLTDAGGIAPRFAAIRSQPLGPPLGRTNASSREERG